MSLITYKITKFDPENKVLDVVFEDGGWAQITLSTPLPTTVDALDEIIKRFTAPIEHIEAKMSSVSLDYINALVGIPRTTTRFSITGRSTPKTEEEVAADQAVTDAVASDIEAMEVARIRALFNQFMAEQTSP